MFKSIFSKLIVIFISISIIGFTLTGVMLYYFLTDFVLDERIEELEQSGQEISSYLIDYIKYGENSISKIFLSRILESYSMNTGSIIFIINSKGYVVNSGPDIARIPDLILDKFIREENSLRLPDERMYDEVMLSKDSVIETGDFFGMFKETGYDWLTLQKRFMYKSDNINEEIIAAVYFHTPIPEIQKARSSVFRFFMISVLVSIIISIILVYIFSLKISRPLKQIKSAAKTIAGGEFRKRLNIHSNDEIGELAKSFNQMVEALQNLEQMRRNFIANVSHELRTPMTSMRGFIEGILDGTIPPESQMSYLKIVRDEVNRLNRLVNNLLDLAKMEAGEMKMVSKVFNINELIRMCIIKLEELIVRKNINIKANFEDEEVYVNADQDAIERVAYNLIHNAIKFCHDKGEIIISVEQIKDKVYVSVEDNGIGIEKNETNLIWERFHKSDKSRGRDKMGTGLGLAIVKNIISEHQQDIWVESEPGKSTKFTFTLAKA